MILPKIYPITNEQIAEISHAEQVTKFIDGGLDFIQIREKNASSNEFYQSAKEVVKIARKTKAKIIINDRVDIALYTKADGVHLGQDDLPPEKAREILGEKAIIGLSTHSKKQAIDALKLPIDYIAIGPVFATKTKITKDSALGIKGVSEVRNVIGGFPLTAIGGITVENYNDVLDAGANSVALISAILLPHNKIEVNITKFNKV